MFNQSIIQSHLQAVAPSYGGYQMSSPIFDKLSANIDALKDAAYKRGHLKARLEMLDALKSLNTEMVSPEKLFQQIVELLGKIETPAKAPKTRKKVVK
jgi:hypothetical protein